MEEDQQLTVTVLSREEFCQKEEMNFKSGEEDDPQLLRAESLQNEAEDPLDL